MIILVKEIVIYIPSYNCENYIEDVISGIPDELHDLIECLIIDNCSTDDSVSTIISLIKNNNLPFKITLVQTNHNLGYSGSQKLAYQIVINSKKVKKVIMLHSDGQYPPRLLLKLKPLFNSNSAVISGYRSKLKYHSQEETPLITYSFVKILSIIENLLTGFKFKEWHSGFVMYSIEFLKKIPIKNLTSSRHIDGEILICAGMLQEQVISIPIYKLYRRHVKFSGFGLLNYVCLDVPKIILMYLFGYYKKLLSGHSSNENIIISDQYDILVP